jgi:uncharacterized RDD family membrane protein YckC
MLIVRRVIAYLIDILLLYGTVILIAQSLIAITLSPIGPASSGIQIELYVLITISLPVWLYFIFSESSKYQATFGKRLMKLKVVNSMGNRISFARALMRTCLKLLPTWELIHMSVLIPKPLIYEKNPGIPVLLIAAYVFMILYFVVLAFSHGKRSVHDLIVRTEVKLSRN